MYIYKDCVGRWRNKNLVSARELLKYVHHNTILLISLVYYTT